jgi:hypothetical protein
MMIVFPKKVLRRLGQITLLLLVASLGMQAITVLGWGDHWQGVERLFNLDKENNIPTWYSSTCLLVCALLLFIIARDRHHQSDRDAKRWLWLSWIFVYLAIDEAASIHELLIAPMQHLLQIRQGGFLYFAWVVPMGILLLGFVAIYWNFVLRLPRKTRRLFVAAGCIYVGGALGMEMVGGQLLAFHPETHVVGKTIFVLVLALEETLELVGLSLLIYALLDFMERAVPEVRLWVGDRAKATALTNGAASPQQPIPHEKTVG